MIDVTRGLLGTVINVGDYVVLPSRSSRNEVGLRWGKIIRADKDSVTVVTSDSALATLPGESCIYVDSDDVPLEVRETLPTS